MNHLTHLRRKTRSFLWVLLCTLLAISCNDHDVPGNSDAAIYPSDAVRSWLTMQLKLAQAMPGSPPVLARRFAYTSIAIYESIAPGLAGYQSIAPQLNGLSAIPQVTTGLTYYWPACANAAAAEMNRTMHPALIASAKTKIDSLESENLERYKQNRPEEELVRSAAFGKLIAKAVFDWSKSDGYDNVVPYTPLIGAPFWKPTPPAFAAAILSNWGKNRLLVANSDALAAQGAPTAYSEDPSSDYYKEVEELYTISQNLTTEQRTIATYWPDNSWHNVLSQVLAEKKPNLGEAAAAFARMSIAMSDGAVSLCKGKYEYHGVRPITYIRTVMNHPDWNTVIPTPPHPEYPSGHSVMSAAAAEALTQLFGNNYAFIDKPYNLTGFLPRSYSSFEAAAEEAAISRVYSGIHYRKTCLVSLKHGKIIAQNLATKLKFKL